MERRTAAFAALAAALAVAVTLPLTPASAQDPGLYTVEGTVRDPAGEPVAGAEVTISPANETDGSRTTRTDDQGRYAFRNLTEGTYDLTAGAACCGPDYEQVRLSGTTLSRQVDLDLTDQAEPRADETVVLRGRTFGSDEGGPVGDVRVHAEVRYTAQEASDAPTDGDEEEPRHRRLPHREESFVVRSDGDGTYALEIPRGEVQLEARRDGYDVTQAHTDVEGDRRLDIPVRPTETPAARLGGVVRSDDGEPLAGADVSVRWDPGECRERPCPERSRDAPDDESRESDGVRFHIRPAASRYDHVTAGADGSWNLSVHPGSVVLRARESHHLPDRTRLDVEGGEERQVNLTLERIPPDSVRVTGTVTDAESGDPVPHARISVENQRWGTHNATRAGEGGSYEVTVKPGYTVLSVRVDRGGHACAQAESSGTAEEDTSTSGKTTSGSTSGSATVRPDPCPDDEPRRPYLPRHRTIQPSAGEERTFSPALEPGPTRSATVRGWVLNASSGEGLERVTLTLRNEVTGQRGWATTDGDGSFTVDVTSGYYTVRAPQRRHRDSYFRAVENVEVGPDATHTMDLNLTPGTPRDRCCVVYGATAVSAEDSRSAATGASAPEDGASGSSTSVPETGGAGVFRGSGGDLGPYDPAQLGTAGGSGGDGFGAPGPGLLPAAAAGLAGAALRSRS